MVKAKKNDKPLTIEMQFALDFPLLVQQMRKKKKVYNPCPKLDHFNMSKPKDYSIQHDINNLITSYIQLHNIAQSGQQTQSRNAKIMEIYKSIINKKFIPLRTFASVINDVDISDNVKTTIKETIEIYGKCPQCGVQFVTINESTYCPECFLETTNINAKDTSSMNGVDKFKSTYLYKRVSHYINKLDKLTACENTKVPQEVIEMIKNETIKEHRDIKKITIDRIKYYLSKHSMTKYSDNANQIYKILTGKQRVYIPPIIQNMLIENFTKIDQVLSQMTEQEGNVNNFLNYSYLHYKICEHLKLKDYKNLFPLCKSQEKIHAHDNIWKTICGKIGWKFIPTV